MTASTAPACTRSPRWRSRRARRGGRRAGPRGQRRRRRADRRRRRTAASSTESRRSRARRCTRVRGVRVAGVHRAARHPGRFGPAPDVVLSGINRGANTGAAVLHSGTVGAAFTAVANGCRRWRSPLDVRPRDAAERRRGTPPPRSPATCCRCSPATVRAQRQRAQRARPATLRGIRRAHARRVRDRADGLLEQGQGYVRMSLEQVDDGAEPRQRRRVAAGRLRRGARPCPPPGEAATSAARPGGYGRRAHRRLRLALL